MATDPANGETSVEVDVLAAIRDAESLADLVALTGADSEHEAYFSAKATWYDLREAELESYGTDPEVGVPGTTVVVDGVPVHVHGVTHAGTDAERSFLRDHVVAYLDAGGAVYCEEGIRSMYFDDVPEVCSMDDYRWAMRECAKRDVDTHLEGVSPATFEGLVEEADALAGSLREATFSLIESGSEVYGDEFASALGDVASSFLTSHTDAGTGKDFESFQRSRAAATDPTKLPALQRYYERRFLPQPLEREWLRRHDPELEVMTHARNERMADYAVYHAGDADAVHLVVGAAHQPGVRYYLQAHRDGRRDLDGFEPVA